MKFTKKQRNALIAVSIGDGHVDKEGQISILHCEAQLEYLKWKHEYLSKLGIKVCPIREKQNGDFKAYTFNVAKTSFSKLLRKILYNPKKDYYSRKILNRLDPIHLAIWYMDDGGLSQKKRKNIIIGNELMINTHTSKENNQIIIDYFKEKWDISFNQYLNKGLYRLACGTKEARKFIKIISPYTSNICCMYHKFNIKKEPIFYKDVQPLKVGNSTSSI
jgi:hypothetical protein